MTMMMVLPRTMPTTKVSSPLVATRAFRFRPSCLAAGTPCAVSSGLSLSSRKICTAAWSSLPSSSSDGGGGGGGGGPRIRARANSRLFSVQRQSSFSSSSSLQQPGNAAAAASSKVEISPANHGTSPWTTFDNSSNQRQQLDDRVLQTLIQKGLSTPTPIQAHAMPLLLRGDDVMASAQTGSGKTLMFALPLVHRLLVLAHEKNGHGSRGKTAWPDSLILSPTRELAQQTATVLRELVASIPNIQVRLATGGSDTQTQRRQLLDNNNNKKQLLVLVATPGRVQQFIDERLLRLDACREIVVDEADRMLDLGFEPQLRRIARALTRRSGPQSSSSSSTTTSSSGSSGSRHTVLCSATFPPEVQRIASEFLQESYYFVAAGRVGATHENIQQSLQWVDNGNPVQRRKMVVDIVRQHNDSSRVVVFTNTKDEAERLAAALVAGNVKGGVRVVHGDKAQAERNKSLAAFRQGSIQTLVATDVAARGLDVQNVGLVVQMDAPRNVDDYVHRIGRTGRAGKKGRAVALVDGRSVSMAPDLVRLLREANQDVPIWLLGMSHVATVRNLEEQSAIAAGGGNLSDRSAPTPLVAETLDEENNFTEQDFRSTATAGSWGSERDTTYRSFDEEAYKSLDEMSLPKEEGSFLDLSSEASTNGVAEMERLLFESEIGQQSSSPDIKAPKSDDYFPPGKPSRELSQKLKELSGSDHVTGTPNQKILSTLSRRDANQRLRFEYLGMFPLESVSDALKTKGFRQDKDNQHLPRVLMVAEKPSIAKAIAEALSGPRKARERRGISRALPVYEFTTDSFDPLPSEKGQTGPFAAQVTVTSVVGHIFGLGFDEDRTSNSRRDPSEYFRMPVVKQEESTTGKLRVVDHLVALAAESDYLVLWLDLDAEGENIAHEVIGVVRRSLEQNAVSRGQDNPLALPTRRISRARFSSITGEALRDAFSCLEEPDPALSRSVDARQELDLRVGVAMTRLLNWKCVGYARDHFSAATKLVSYGPCQTPALSLCVDRAREIKQFVPRNYWKVHILGSLSANMKQSVPLRWKVPTDDAVEDRTWSRNRRDDENLVAYEANASFNSKAAHELIAVASSSRSGVTVVRVDTVSDSIRAPLGLNTVALLSAGSKAMGLSPKQVMNVAEKLYSQGFISYPRTETTKYDPNGFDVRSMLRQHLSHPEWGKTAAHLLRTKYANSGRPPTRGRDEGDHPPITTVRPATRDEVGGGVAWRVYEFISRNFLGSLADDFVFTRHVAHLEMDNSAHELEFEQVEVEELGFAGACPWVLKDVGASRKGETLPLREGARFKIEQANITKDATRPPRFLQEHELIELMDHHRIGTDASMATHVNNIVDRNYVVLCDETGEPLRPPRPPIPGRPRPPRQVGRYLVPTPLGLSLIDLFGAIDKADKAESKASLTEGQSTALLARPSIRAQMEREVRQIALGELDKDEVLKKNLNWFEERFTQFETELKSRLRTFRSSLQPTKKYLKACRSLRVFEPQVAGTKQGTNTKYTKKAHQAKNKLHGKSSGQRKRPQKGPKSSQQSKNRRHAR